MDIFQGKASYLYRSVTNFVLLTYLSRCPRSYNNQRRVCCKFLSSKLSVVAEKWTLIAQTREATSMGLVHFKAWLFWYLQFRSLVPCSAVWPRRSSVPLPCQVTSKLLLKFFPNTIQEWSSERANRTSFLFKSWQAADTPYETP